MQNDSLCKPYMMVSRLLLIFFLQAEGKPMPSIHSDPLRHVCLCHLVHEPSVNYSQSYVHPKIWVVNSYSMLDQVLVTYFSISGSFANL